MSAEGSSSWSRSAWPRCPVLAWLGGWDIMHSSIGDFERTSARDDTTLTVGLLVSYVVLDQYVFRFQRTTRGITQQIGGGMSFDLQIALTPGWVGAIGWLNKIVMLATGFMVWRTWGWIPLSGFALYAFFLGSLVDVHKSFSNL